MAVHTNRAGMSSTTVGAGATILLSAALGAVAPNVCSFQDFGTSGLLNGQRVEYLVLDNNGNWEAGEADFSTSGPSLLNRAPSDSSSGGLSISLSGNQQVFITALATSFGKPLFLYFTGQSNFAVSGTLAWTPAKNLRIWNNTVGTVGTGTAFTTPDSANVNVCQRIASEIARRYPTRQVYALIEAFSGQTIDQWLVGAGAPDVFADTANNITPALAAAGVSSIDGMFWWQGESSKTDANYMSKWATMIARFQGTSWFPQSTPVVICALTSTADSTFVVNDMFNDQLEAIAAVDPASRKFVNTYPNLTGTTYWQTAGGPQGLGHMTAAGYYAAGAEIATAFLNGSSKAAAPAIAIDSTAHDALNINGSHDISQWNVNTAVVLTSGGILLTDQWKGFCQGPVATGQRVATPFSTRLDIAYGLKINITTAKGALSSGDFLSLVTTVEGQRSKRLGFGTAIARPCALGFWVNSSIAFVGYVAVRNSATNRSFTRRISLSAGVDTWVSLTYPGCTDGTWATDNTNGLSVTFSLAAGSAVAVATADTWQTSGNVAASDQTNLGATLSNNIIISNLILVPGLLLPSSDHSVVATRAVEEEMRLCLRHIEKSYDQATAVGTATSNHGLATFSAPASVPNGDIYGSVRFAVPKRTNGYTATVYSYGGVAGKVSDGGLSDLAANSGAVASAGEGSFGIFNNSGGAVAPGGLSIWTHWAVDNSL